MVSRSEMEKKTLAHFKNLFVEGEGYISRDTRNFIKKVRNTSTEPRSRASPNI